MKQDARFLSVKILNRFEKKNEQLVIARNQIFSSFKPESMDKSRAMVLTNEIIRLRGRLDVMIEYVSGRKINRLDPSLLSILRIGFYEIIYDESIPDYAAVDSLVNLTKTVSSRKASKLTNAVLRNLIRYRDKDSNWDEPLKKKPKWVSLPIWLQKRWKYQFGESGFFALVNCINQNSKIFVRVDLTNHTVDDAKESLLESGIEAENYSDSFLKILTGSGKIFSTDLFQSGQVSIQNPASGAIVEFLDPLKGETVLDVCAAPGTKSLRRWPAPACSLPVRESAPPPPDSPALVRTTRRFRCIPPRSRTAHALSRQVGIRVDARYQVQRRSHRVRTSCPPRHVRTANRLQCAVQTADSSTFPAAPWAPRQCAR